MSMIYECPSCHTPQAAGQTSCPQCGADFEGPVPDDAVVPEPTVAAADLGETVTPGETPTFVPPPQEAAPPTFPAPPSFPTTAPPLPTYQPPPYTAPPVYQNVQPPQRLGGSLPKPLLIGIPVVLALVLAAVFFTRNLDQGSDTTTATAPVTTPVTSPAVSTPAPTPASPPVTLSGGGSSSAADSGASKFLVGRWQSKSSDFYVFNDNSTGSRGSITGKQSKEVFVWVLAQSDLILYTDKQEKLTFSPGADDNSMFLRGQDGRYIEYRRAKTNA